MIKPDVYEAIGRLAADQKDERYYLEKDDVYLSGTAEVPVTAYFSNEVLRETDLPKKFFLFLFILNITVLIYSGYRIIKTRLS